MLLQARLDAESGHSEQQLFLWDAGKGIEDPGLCCQDFSICEYYSGVTDFAFTLRL